MVQCHACNNTNRYWIGRKVNQLLILMYEFTDIKLLWASIFIKKSHGTALHLCFQRLIHLPTLLPYADRGQKTPICSRKLRVWVARLNHLEQSALSDSYDAILHTCVHLPQSPNLKMPVGLGAQDVPGSGCQGSLVFFTAALTEPFGVRNPWSCCPSKSWSLPIQGCLLGELTRGAS